MLNLPVLVSADCTSRMCATTARSTPDPMAQRPTKVCDPYGQNGRPLGRDEATALLSTLDDGWELVGGPKTHDGMDGQGPLVSVNKEFYHPDFLSGSKFGSIVASVGHNNNHYPSICLERRLVKREKSWRVVTTVKCFTETLGGLSFNDFHIATMVDVEAARPDIQNLLVDGNESFMKHI